MEFTHFTDSSFVKDLCLSENKRLRFIDIIVESFLFGVDVSQKLQLSGSLLR